MIALFIDADACPVKQEIYRVAERHALKGTALKVFVVSNSPIAVPRDPLIERVVVGAGMDEADNWIAERAGAGAIVITADVPLASRAVKAGAEAIAPNGRAFTADSIGMTLGDAQPDGFVAQRRRDHRRPKTVFAARPLELSRRRWIRPSCGSSAPGSGGRRVSRRRRNQALAGCLFGKNAFAESDIAMIRKLPSGKYRLYSRKKNPKTGRRRNLGTFASRAAAEKHERAVQYFKRH